ncbi:mitochondrial carrier domain-containing protein [Phyllosticta citribraziliensis]|uniref:Mitochondrial carrier domain-containing protein n=1 Tax=Phyllosticta citribraziliensis TaxID=989973 RepID=A0ABR1LFD7_9PEZI
MPSSAREDGAAVAAPQHPVPDSVVMRHEYTKLCKKYRTEIAASSSSLLSTVTAYPLDSVKTRMQTYSNRFTGVVDCVQHTYRTEGTKGFWRGVISPLASITLVRTVSFSVYQRAKYTYDEWMKRATGSSPLAIANSTGAMPNIATMSCFGAAGATAGAVITFIACPFELTKMSAQISVLAQSKEGNAKPNPISASYAELGTLRTAQNLVRQRGFGGLYAGVHYHLLRDSIGTGIYFTTYESSKQLLANARGNSPTSPLAVVIAGGLCGLVSWACIYPIDTAKSIYQRNCFTQHRNKTDRPKIQFFNPRMYKGIGVSMSRSCVVNAIFFSAFEYTKKRINRLEYDEELLRTHGRA